MIIFVLFDNIGWSGICFIVFLVIKALFVIESYNIAIKKIILQALYLFKNEYICMFLECIRFGFSHALVSSDESGISSKLYEWDESFKRAK